MNPGRVEAWLLMADPDSDTQRVYHIQDGIAVNVETDYTTSEFEVTLGDQWAGCWPVAPEHTITIRCRGFDLYHGATVEMVPTTTTEEQPYDRPEDQIESVLGDDQCDKWCCT